MPTNHDITYIVRGSGSFGPAIREFRHRRGLTQAELAERANLHRSYLSSIEAGVTTEALKSLMRTLNALDLEITIRPKRSTQWRN
ncbi:MAG: helix-turn-helix transcriptional regulator [Acidimicrobiaceae bacterium]|nr:helix-turn-helix transcriptional regulator [Acidimicrobiaceae bacterium]